MTSFRQFETRGYPSDDGASYSSCRSKWRMLGAPKSAAPIGSTAFCAWPANEPSAWSVTARNTRSLLWFKAQGAQPRRTESSAPAEPRHLARNTWPCLLIGADWPADVANCARLTWSAETALRNTRPQHRYIHAHCEPLLNARVAQRLLCLSDAKIRCRTAGDVAGR